MALYISDAWLSNITYFVYQLPNAERYLNPDSAEYQDFQTAFCNDVSSLQSNFIFYSILRHDFLLLFSRILFFFKPRFSRIASFITHRIQLLVTHLRIISTLAKSCLGLK